MSANICQNVELCREPEEVVDRWCVPGHGIQVHVESKAAGLSVGS